MWEGKLRIDMTRTRNKPGILNILNEIKEPVDNLSQVFYDITEMKEPH